MQHNISDCRAWFSHQGYTTRGSAQTATGRINCYLNAAVAGDYSCVAQLQSDPTTSGATVECLIDNQSFGNLPFTGADIGLMAAELGWSTQETDAKLDAFRKGWL